MSETNNKQEPDDNDDIQPDVELRSSANDQWDHFATDDQVDVNDDPIDPTRNPDDQPELDDSNHLVASDDDTEMHEIPASTGSSNDLGAEINEETTDFADDSDAIAHSHGHNHDTMGDWDILATHPLLRYVLGFLTAVLTLTVVGVIVLRPTGGESFEEILENAELSGIHYEQYSAEVSEVRVGACSWESDDKPSDEQQICRSVFVTLDDKSVEDEPFVLGEFALGQHGVEQLTVGRRIVIGREVGDTTPATAAFGDQAVAASEPFYFLEDYERRPPLILLTLTFATLVIALARKRGAYALLSMLGTVIILWLFVAPSMLEGNNPVLVAVVGASIIAFLSLYMTHGFNPTTTVALAGTLLALILTLAVSSIFIALGQFVGTSDAASLTLLGLDPNISIASLLIAGAIIGALGALDDITVTQVATIAELHHRRPNLTIKQLYVSGLRVGREHIASTVNTLLLAYAGASLPMLLILTIRARGDRLSSYAEPLTGGSLGPISSMLRFFERQFNVTNAEELAIEVVRTLCGSIGLVAAVPLTTILAAILVGTSGQHEIALAETTTRKATEAASD